MPWPWRWQYSAALPRNCWTPAPTARRRCSIPSLEECLTEKLYLRPDVMVEPLIARWYGWFHLIPPATAALNIVKSHFKIMDGYVKNPRVHQAATRNPALLGGPFMDYEGDRTAEVAAL